jgi:hypothetical protein
MLYLFFNRLDFVFHHVPIVTVHVDQKPSAVVGALPSALYLLFSVRSHITQMSQASQPLLAKRCVFVVSISLYLFEVSHTCCQHHKRKKSSSRTATKKGFGVPTAP